MESNVQNMKVQCIRPCSVKLFPFADSHAVHHHEEVREIIEGNGATLLFLYHLIVLSLTQSMLCFLLRNNALNQTTRFL